MSEGTEAWTELVKGSFGMIGTSLRTSEMLVASGSVIGAQTTIMGTAARQPAEGDCAELGDMVAEKVVAVSKVNQALVDQQSAMLLDASEQAQHVGVLLIGGHPVSARDLTSLTDRWLAYGTRMMTRTMETGALALAPVHHQQATANARRLG